MPAKYEEQLASWHRLHPHWRFEFWDDARSRRLVWERFPQYGAAFDDMSGIKQADAARVVALYTYGGVYADIDVEATRCFDDLLEASAAVRAGVLLGEENAVHTVLLERRLSEVFVSNAVMASAPGHPFWLRVLSEIFTKSRSCGTDPVLCTGPRLIDRLSLDHVRQKAACGRWGCVVRLPFEYFSPHIAHWNAGAMTRSCRELLGKHIDSRHSAVAQAACQRLERALVYPGALRSKETFAVHHWQCSWCRSDPAFLQTIPLRAVLWRAGNESLAATTLAGTAKA